MRGLTPTLDESCSLNVTVGLWVDSSWQGQGQNLVREFQILSGENKM